MATYAILIRNSDDQLPQASWATFCTALHELAGRFATSTSGVLHFAGHTAPYSTRQSACVVLELGKRANNATEGRLYAELDTLRQSYGQEAIAVVRGVSTLIGV